MGLGCSLWSDPQDNITKAKGGNARVAGKQERAAASQAYTAAFLYNGRQPSGLRSGSSLILLNHKIVSKDCKSYVLLAKSQGEADVNQNNGTSTKSPAVTDSKGTADPKNAWPQAHPADTAGRPHLIRLFSRDAPGREDNTFKDRPSESDELQTIQEDSAAASENSDLMASQKRSSFRHGSKMASASTIDHARHGSPRHRDSGLLDSLGRFFGGDRHVPRRGSGKVSSEE
ncbi:hypothetical protein ASZ78_004008 [Callipepla squamata]|uniref:Myelin basic protein n=1 Tax=Callipepla squamata TaxID=9009 RepID=A0A226NFV7_CALSU|nr:hypothetical protein ASZ78_004008 [Callipepla squamata]